MIQQLKIDKGLYIIVDPTMDPDQIQNKLRMVLHLPISAVQIWDHFPRESDEKTIVENIAATCHAFRRPVIINNRWEYLMQFPLDGVHFDIIPDNYDEILRTISRPFLKGLTCNNDLDTVRWAHLHRFDYISFCSVFPSATANSCELINLEIVRKVINEYNLPVFLAGGITPNNMGRLSDIAYHGIAVLSGIMLANDPLQAALQYLKQFKW